MTLPSSPHPRGRPAGCGRRWARGHRLAAQPGSPANRTGGGALTSEPVPPTHVPTWTIGVLGPGSPLDSAAWEGPCCPAGGRLLPPSHSTGAERKVGPSAKYAKTEGRQFSAGKTAAGREPRLPATTRAGSEIIRSSDSTGCGGTWASLSQRESRAPQRQKWPLNRSVGPGL